MVQPLTTASGPLLRSPDADFSAHTFLSPRQTLHIGRAGEEAARERLMEEFAGRVELDPVDPLQLVPGLRPQWTVGLLERNPLNLDVVVAPLADWRDKLKETRIPILSDAVGEVAGAIQKLLNTATSTLLYEFRVGGDLKDVKVTTVPAPVLTDAAATIFGKMLNPKKGERPLDWIKSGEKPAK